MAVETYEIMTDVTSNQTSQAFELISRGNTVHAYGVSGGATVSVQGSSNGTDWMTIGSVAIPSIALVPGNTMLAIKYLRFLVTGANGSTNFSITQMFMED